MTPLFITVVLLFNNVCFSAACSTSSVKKSLSIQVAPAASPCAIPSYHMDIFKQHPLLHVWENNTLNKGDTIKVAAQAENDCLNNRCAGRDAWMGALASHHRSVQDELTRLRKQSPLWYLRECIAPECSLSRPYFPHRREAFEQEGVQELCAQACVKEGLPVNYVAFASGGMTPHVRTLLQAFKKGFAAPLNVHVIDTRYKGYLRSLKKQKEVPAFSEFVSEMHGLMLECIEYAHKTSQSIDVADLHSIYEQHEMLSRCLMLLKEAHPTADCNLFVHASADDYLQFCSGNPEHRGDILSTVDLGLDCSASAKVDHAKLQDYILSLKKNAVSLYMPAGISLFYMDGKEVDIYRFSQQERKEGFGAIAAREIRVHNLGIAHDAWEKSLLNTAYNPSKKTVPSPTKLDDARLYLKAYYYPNKPGIVRAARGVALLAAVWYLCRKLPVRK